MFGEIIEPIDITHTRTDASCGDVSDPWQGDQATRSDVAQPIQVGKRRSPGWVPARAFLQENRDTPISPNTGLDSGCQQSSNTSTISKAR